MSLNDSSDNGIPVCDGQAEVRGVRGAAVNSQVTDLLMNPQEHRAPMTSASALDAINKANQILPYLDMTQAFMVNPDPNYKKVETFKPEPQPTEDGAAPGTGPGRRRTPAPQTRRT